MEKRKSSSEEDSLSDVSFKDTSFDAILAKTGPTGMYQIRTLILMTWAKSFPAMITILPVLASGKMTHKCKLPTQQLNETVNVTATECELVYNSMETGDVWRKTCTDWEFSEDTFFSSVRSAYQLVCGWEFLTQLATTMFFLGFMVGCTLYSIISDRFGRLVGILTSAFHLSLFGALAAIAPSFWVYAFLRFVAGIGNGGLLATLYTMTAEITNQKVRAIWCMIVPNGWSVGVMVLALVGYFIRNHVTLQLALAIPVSCLLISYLFVYESPRWLYATGKFERANHALQRIAKVNGRVFDAVVNDSNTKLLTNDAPKVSFLKVFGYPGLRRVTFLVWINWFAVSMGYFGMMLSIDLLPGSIYTNLLIMASIEIPARALGLLLAVKIGRRWTMILFYALSGLALLARVAMAGRQELDVVIRIVSVIGQFGFMLVFDVVWMYSAEVFPTVIRNVGVGVGSTWARVGAMLAPQISLLGVFWTQLPFVIFGGLPLCAALGSFFLPETNGQLLSQTLEEGESLAKGLRQRINTIEVEDYSKDME